MELEIIKLEYESKKPALNSFRLALCHELEILLSKGKISLGVPIESRVKEYSSMVLKMEKGVAKPNSILDVSDLIGIRLILLFKRDIEKVRNALLKNFTLISEEDTGRRLGQDQFGYRSFHFNLRLKKNWVKIPTFSEFGKIVFEIQVRTLAQHIWAAASHELQYKNEENVPDPIRRSIHRVSALLETVDLEFERVLNERQAYISQIRTSDGEFKINVDSLAKLLDEILPARNKVPSEEEYSELLKDLLTFKIDSTNKLTQIWKKHEKEALADDEKVALQINKNPKSSQYSERTENGYFFAHTGLIRKALALEFGSKFDNYLNPRIMKSIRAKRRRAAV